MQIRHLQRATIPLTLFVSLLAACGKGEPAPIVDGGARLDGGALPDGGPARDGGPAVDGGAPVDGGPPADGGPPSDGGPAIDGGSMEVEVGTGQFEFVPIADGGLVDIVCGPQGGQHIWVSARARNFDPRAANLQVSIVRMDNGMVVCGQQLREVDFLPAMGFNEYTGIACFVPDPDVIRGQPVRLDGVVTDRAGRDGGASAFFVPTGPATTCTLGGGGDGGTRGGEDGGG